MKRDVYYRGKTGKKYGIWNSMKKEFQFGICEDTPMLAMARLHQKIGDDARKYRFEPRVLPDNLVKVQSSMSEEALAAIRKMGRKANGIHDAEDIGN